MAPAPVEPAGERPGTQPSLCQGWSVRDVGAHLAFSHARVRDVLWSAVRTGFPLQRDDQVTPHSTLAHEQIVAILRGFVGSRRKAPIFTELEPLLDILVHTQEICIPLGIEHSMLGRRGRRGRGPVLVLRGPMRLWKPPKGIRLVATEADWADGEGPMVEALPRHSGRRIPCGYSRKGLAARA